MELLTRGQVPARLRGHAQAAPRQQHGLPLPKHGDHLQRQRPKGGFITIARTQDTDLARLRLHNSIVEGRIIEVNLATPKNSAPKPLCSTASLFGSLGPAAPLPKTPSTIVWRKPLTPTSYKPSPRTMLEAEARLAEAQLTVLQLRQKMMYQQFRTGLGAGGDMDQQEETRGERSASLRF